MKQFEYFIAKRLFFQKETQKKAGPAVKIAVIGISVGLAVMLIAVSVVLGFKEEVRAKIVGVSAHIQVSSYYSNNTYEMSPIQTPDTVLDQLEALPGIRHVQRMYTKTGMIKTDENFQAIVCKGIDDCFDMDFLRHYLVAGQIPDFSTNPTGVLLSEYISKQLNLPLGASLLVYFVRDDAVSVRKFEVAGIYNTYFTQFDQHFVLTSAQTIQALNRWQPQESAGLELFLEDGARLDPVEDAVYEKMEALSEIYDDIYYIRNLNDLYPDLFGWLALLDMNVLLILLLMVFVSGFNIISGLLILILERTNMIGVLKALGASNQSVRTIFRYYALFLIGKGMLWGNLVGLSVLLLQNLFHLLKLDPNVYYVDAVPMDFRLFYILAINLGTFLVALFVILIPSTLVARIHPVRAIRFE